MAAASSGMPVPSVATVFTIGGVQGGGLLGGGSAQCPPVAGSCPGGGYGGRHRTNVPAGVSGGQDGAPSVRTGGVNCDDSDGLAFFAIVAGQLIHQGTFARAW